MDFNYFYDNAGLSRDRLRFLWEFSNSFTTGILDSSSGDYSHSGTFAAKSDFYSIAGKGLFGNTRARVANSASIDTRQFTLIMDYSGIRNEAEILFSNYITGDSDSYGVGFSLCKNNCNRLYLVADTSDETAELKTFDINLANRNIIALRKAHNTLTLSYYNPYSTLIESQTVTFSHKVNSANSTMYFGGNSDLERLGYEDYFSGTIDQIAYIDHSISNMDLSGILNGFRIYDEVPVSTESTLESGHNRIEYSIDSVHANYNAIFGEYTDGIHEALVEIQDTNKYIIGITGDSDGSVIDITGTISGYTDGVITFVSGYSWTGVSPNAYLSNFTGYVSYVSDEYGNTFSYHNNNYLGVTVAVPTFKAYNSIYKRYSLLDVGGTELNEASLPHYKMDGITVVDQTLESGFLFREYDEFLIQNFNRTAPSNFAQSRLIVPDGTGIDLYVNRSLTTSYTFDGSVLTFNNPYTGANTFYYDRPTVDATYSLITGVGSGINHRFFKNASIVHYLGNETKRLSLGTDYKETATLDLLYNKHLLPPQTLDSIYTGTPEFWTSF